MRVVGIGVDLVETARMARWLDRFDDAVLRAVCTPAELVRVRGDARRLAIGFAAKEACGKALGCGLAGIDWSDIDTDVCGTEVGIALAGRAARLADRLGVTAWAGRWQPVDPDVLLVRLVALAAHPLEHPAAGT